MSHDAPNVDYPDQEEVISKLEMYKKDYGRYPDSLDSIGFVNYLDDGGTYGANYWLDNDKFHLCYSYWRIVETDILCYNLDSGKWEGR